MPEQVPDSARIRRSDPDVLVVGAGVVGLFCAYYLRLGGASVTVIDRGAVGGPQSCSSGNTGFVGTQGAAPLAEPGVLTHGLRWLVNPASPLYIRPRPSRELATWLWRFARLCNEEDARACFGVLVEMKRRSLDLLRKVCGEPGLAATFAMPGMIVAFKNPREFDQACRSVPLAVSRGVPLRVLSEADLRALEPDVDFDISGALLNAEGAMLRTPEFLLEFASLLCRMGVEIVKDVRVTRFDARDVNGRGFDARGPGAGGRRIRRVCTSVGDFTPGEVVIAAGAWSARLGRLLGIRLMLQPAKGYTVTVDAPRAAPRLPMVLSEGKVAVTPLGDQLRFGGTLELGGGLERGGITVSRRRVDGITATVRSYLPGIDVASEPQGFRGSSSGSVPQVWAGVRACTPDSLPFLGRGQPYLNLSIACGHGYIGMGLAPVSGKLIAQLVRGEPPEMDLAPFRVGRFSGR